MLAAYVTAVLAALGLMAMIWRGWPKKGAEPWHDRPLGLNLRAALVELSRPAIALRLLAMGAIGGVIGSMAGAPINAAMQVVTPNEMRGRVSAVNSVFIGASNQLGEFESGASAALLGPVGSVVAGGIGTLLVAALWLKAFPALAQRDRMSGS